MKRILLPIFIMSFLSQNCSFALENENKGENKHMAKIVQTAGRDNLGSFAPNFAHYNDDILFGENWNNKDIPIKTRCIITVVALMSQGITDTSRSITCKTPKITEFPKMRLRRRSRTPLFTRAGLRLGQHLIWQKRFGMKTRPR